MAEMSSGPALNGRRRPLAEEKRAEAKAMIGRCRRAAGMSLEELAERVGISPRSLAEYERPGGPCPSRPLYADLGVALRSPTMLTYMMPPGFVVLLAGDPATATAVRVAQLEATLAKIKAELDAVMAEPTA